MEKSAAVGEGPRQIFFGGLGKGVDKLGENMI